MKKINTFLISILILLFISSCGISRFSTTYSEIPGYYGVYPYSGFYARNLNSYPYYYGGYSNFYSYRNFNVQLQPSVRNYTSIPSQQPPSNNYSTKSIPYKSK